MAVNDLQKQAASGGWSKSGPLATLNSTLEASMQVQFPISGAYTIAFGIEEPEAVGGIFRITEAEIAWSVAGNTVRRRVTAGNGVSVTGNGEGVSVKLKDYSINTGVGTTRPYVVHASVAPGVRPAKNQPPILTTRTPEPILLVGGATSIVQIPPDAGVISAMITAYAFTSASGIYVSVPIPEGTAFVQQLGGGLRLKYYDARTYDFVPIAPGATAIGLANNFAAGTSIYYTVTFGIDG